MKANELKAELALRGLTQSALAEMIGLSPQTLNKQINSGRMGIETATAIVHAIDLDRDKAVDIFLSRK